jgi:hypothetical protein
MYRVAIANVRTLPVSVPTVQLFPVYVVVRISPIIVTGGSGG